MTNIAPTLEVDKQLKLRKPQESDILDRLSYGRPMEFRKMVGGSMENITPYKYADAVRFYERESHNKYSWMIESNGKMIGVCRLKLKPKNSARYSIGIHDESLYSKGIGTKVTNRIITYAFEELKLSKLELMVIEFNKRGIRCYEKCGFKQTELLQDNIEIDGVTYNDIIMEIENK